MRVSAKVDYALRATAELAAAQLEAAQSKADRAGTVKGERLAASQQIPLNFLENILLELRAAESWRASAGPRAATGSRSRPPR